MIGNNGNLTKAGAMLADKILIYQNRLFCTRWNGLTKSSVLFSLLRDGASSIRRNTRIMCR